MRDCIGFVFIGVVMAAMNASQMALAQAPGTTPGFSCERLAQRQSLMGVPGATFRVERLTFTPAYKPVVHHHSGEEILYKLSGNGTNTMNGITTALSRDIAVTVPAGVEHSLQPTKGTTLVVMALQFSDKTKPEFVPGPSFKAAKACHD